MTRALGDLVRLEMTKWGDRPHWKFEALWLGSDAHGDWIGIPAGTPMSRPGAEFRPPVPQVGLSPRVGLPDAERGWLATYYAPGAEVAIYVDITTPPVWDGNTLRTVDLDLDVIRRVDDEVFVDDEDEFAQHRVELGYPDQVSRDAMASCDRVQALVARREPPYDGSHEPWLQRLAGHVGPRDPGDRTS